jgi:hypothetical protein
MAGLWEKAEALAEALDDLRGECMSAEVDDAIVKDLMSAAIAALGCR